MNHSLPLITTLVSALSLALLMGFIATKLKLPPIVGYLLAGIFLGPFTPGFVANINIATELAEIGIMLLMFGVGLHFSWDNLLATRRIALPGALLQIVVATSLGTTMATLWGWPFAHALVFGIALSVASTVVLIKALETQALLNSIEGQIAVGWLIVEDIAMVIALVFLPFLAYTSDANAGQLGNIWTTLGLVLLKIVMFIALMLLVGRWFLPRVLWQITRSGSRELFTLCIITVALSIAFGAAKLFGVSFALGAFFAGTILRESKYAHRAAEESLPFRDAFAVLFFVSVGMLFNPSIFIEHPFQVLAVVSVIIIGKSIAAALLVLAFRYPLKTALTISASLAQIGEFSFVLATYSVELKLLSSEAQALILAGAIISIGLNPLVFKAISPIEALLKSKTSWFPAYERSKDPLQILPITTNERYFSGQVILIGYGSVGRRIGALLAKNDVPFVVVDQNRQLVAQLRTQGLAAIVGEDADSAALKEAHIAKAAMLVLATADVFAIRQMLDTAIQLNPQIRIVVRVKDTEEKTLLQKEIQGVFFLSEEELAKNMGDYILKEYKISYMY